MSRRSMAKHEPKRACFPGRLMAPRYLNSHPFIGSPGWRRSVLYRGSQMACDAGRNGYSPETPRLDADRPHILGCCNWCRGGCRIPAAPRLMPLGPALLCPRHACGGSSVRARIAKGLIRIPEAILRQSERNVGDGSANWLAYRSAT